MSVKHCTKCKELKPLSDYYNSRVSLDGKRPDCKQCLDTNHQKRSRSIDGLPVKIIATQRKTSKRRGHVPPAYSTKQFVEWMHNQDDFSRLYSNWVKSDYDKNLKPSCDRLDDYRPYTLDNIRLTTWGENNDKGNNDIKNGINNKQAKKITQLSLSGDLINTFYSMHQAERVTGISHTNICACCNGRANTAGGFKWKAI